MFTGGTIWILTHGHVCRTAELAGREPCHRQLPTGCCERGEGEDRREPHVGVGQNKAARGEADVCPWFHLQGSVLGLPHF